MKTTPSPQDQEILKLLDALKSVRVEYPPELLANRRAAYVAQIGKLEIYEVKDSQSLEKEEVIHILENLKPVTAEYPSILKAKQRAAFLNQVEQRRRRVGWMGTLRSAIQSWSNFKQKAPAAVVTNAIQRSLILVGVLAAVFTGILFGNLDSAMESARPHPTHGEFSKFFPITPTATYEITKTTCTPDSTSSTCSTNGFDREPDKVSWVSKSANSWIKIDTGKTATIHMVEFDKEYLGSSTGDFTVSVALIDSQYKQVYDSKSDNTTKPVSGPETVQVSFEPELARYVLITVSDPGMAINEVRAFASIQPPTPTPDQIIENTKAPRLLTLTSSSTPSPTRTQTATPTNTPSPTNTQTATLTSTPSPTSTQTATPTNTPSPTSTQTATSTDTPLPTSTPRPTNTPLPTNTLLPTSTPRPTNTPLPTSTRLPTNTPMPASTPLPTNTPLPTSTPRPTNTPLPTSTP